MNTPTSTNQATATGDTPQQRYRMLWRWHFYAGLFVMPLLLLLSITGTLYVFKPQVEAVLYKDRLFVAAPAQNTVRLSYDDLARAAQATLPAQASLLRVNVDDTADHSTELVYRLPSGRKTSIYLNPYNGKVLGRLDIDRRFMQVVRNLHRDLMLGSWGGILMELAATWTLVMLATGIALWWPDKSHPGLNAKGRLRPRAQLRGRLWWRDLHTVIGIWFAAGAFFFVLSGMPWSGVWGANFKALATSMSFGYPDGARRAGHIHSAQPGQPRLADQPFTQTPWATGDTAVPHSAHAGHDVAAQSDAAMDTMPDMPDMPGMPSSHASRTSPPDRASLDKVITSIRRAGLAGGYELAVPQTPDGVFSASYYPEDPRGQRTLHLDQFSGELIAQTSYAEYGFIARAISFGTALHMGQLAGLANQIICAVIALALGGLSLSGLIMWWSRRPRGTLAAPARTASAKVARGWKLGLGVLGLVFPLMGLSLILVALLDWWVFAPKSARASLRQSLSGSSPGR